MSRTYKRGEQPVYDKHFNRMFVKSWILNQGVRENNIELFGKLTSKQSCEAELLRLAGNENGLYFRPDTHEFAVNELAIAKENLNVANGRVSEWQRLQVAQGRDDDIQNLPQAISDHIMMAQATVDIIKAEIKHLKKLAKEFQDKEVKTQPTNILRAGPGAFFERGDDPLFEIDDMRVGFVDGVLLIVDDRPCYDGQPNPYRGMALPDYRKMARKWRKEVEQEYWQRRAELEAEQREAAVKGEPHPGADSLPVPGLNPMPRDRWPEWPPNAINYIEKAKAEKQKEAESKPA